VDRTYFAAKANANFFGNSGRFGLPNIQGVILLFDGETGYPLAIMDSIEITIRRTGAATAVAAKYLARSNSRIATICGCGNQGRIHAQAQEGAPYRKDLCI
jgi:alanine dehydrogenase